MQGVATFLAGPHWRANVVDFHGRFVWYELMTTDMEAAKAFYGKVVGWGGRTRRCPAWAYTLFTAGGASVSGLMDLPEDARKMGGAPPGLDMSASTMWMLPRTGSSARRHRAPPTNEHSRHLPLLHCH